MTPEAIRQVVVAAFLARLAVEGALLLQQRRHSIAAGPAVPEVLRDRVDAATAARSLDYTLARLRLGLASLAWDTAVALGLLLSGVLPWLWQRLGALVPGEALRFVAFLVSLSAMGWVANLPLSLYATFGLERRFGFNRTTGRTWIADVVRGTAVGLALGVPVLLGVWLLMSAAGAAWWIWTWAFLAAVQVALQWLYPSVLAPIFHRFTPLPPGALRDRLELLARDAGFRTRGIHVMDASRRSTHSNAYLAGIVRPRIVLFDTLVSSLSVDEAAAVLAHEIGHFRLRHVPWRIAAGLGSTLVGLWVLSLLVRWPALFRAFGFEGPSWGPALAILWLAGGAFTFFLAPVAAWASRRQERAADRFAVRLARAPGALGAALLKLGRENLANLHPHPWYAAWHHGHPSLRERLEALSREERA